MKNYLLACGLAVGLSLFSFGINDVQAHDGWGGGGYGSYYGGAPSCGRSTGYGSYYGGPSIRIVPGGYQSGFGYSSHYGGGYGSHVATPFGGFGPAYGHSHGSPFGGYGHSGYGYGRGITVGGGGIRINF